MTKQLFVVADKWENNFLPEDQTDYLSRVVGRVGEELRRHHDVEVSYFGAKDLLAALPQLSVSDDAVVLGLRMHDQTTEQALDALSERGARVWVHGADPHWINPVLEDRRAMHTRLLKKAKGVIATSAANHDAAKTINKATGKPYARHVVHLPDAMDRWELAPPLYGEGETPAMGCMMAVIGSSFHLAGFANCAQETIAFAKKNKNYPLILSLMSKTPKAAYDGALSVDDVHACFESYLAIKGFQQAHIAVNWHDYTLQEARKLHEYCDLVVIPNDVLSRMNPWHRMRSLGAGAHRIVDGFAAGKPVLVLGQKTEGPDAALSFPASYTPFLEAGVLLTASSMEEGIERFRNLRARDVKALVREGQEIVKRDHRPSVVAQRYVDHLFIK